MTLKKDNEVIETKIVGQEPKQEIATVENNVQTFNIEDAIKQWEMYQLVTQKLLDKSDYITIRGTAFKKKSAWRKYARAFNISTDVVSKNIEKNDKGIVTEAEFVVRATMPDGRYAEGWGSCSRREGTKQRPNHDIPATAMTRATNRAIADLIGAGEVTAEEMR